MMDVIMVTFGVACSGARRWFFPDSGSAFLFSFFFLFAFLLGYITFPCAEFGLVRDTLRIFINQIGTARKQGRVPVLRLVKSHIRFSVCLYWTGTIGQCSLVIITLLSLLYNKSIGNVLVTTACLPPPRLIYCLLLANFSCHLPLAIVAGAVALPVSATSSIVSWTVPTALRPMRPAAWSSGDEVEGSEGVRRMSALEVFFWRRE